jgi:hypothetical protein
VTDRQAASGAEPTRLRGPSISPRVGAARLTPLRARIERAPAEPTATAVLDRPALAVHEAATAKAHTGFPLDEAATAEANALRPSPAGEPGKRRIVSLPLPLVFGVGAVVIVIVAVIGYLLLPRLSGSFAENSIDPAASPNSSAITAGTPSAPINPQRPTPDAATNGPSASAGAGALTGAAAPAQPTLPPQPDKVASQAGAAAPQPNAGAGSILDERFTTNSGKLPSTPQGTATLTNGSYRLTPRLAGQFVAVAAPMTPTIDLPRDISVTADFRKLGGPGGGGYGIIVRDQGSPPLDGINQNGRYYVLEAGDKGEIGIWRRDGDRWVDLLPWQHADAVKTGNAANELTVRAIGNRLSLSVNGAEVATRSDANLAGGNVGLFVGGDGNQVAVERFIIQTP